MLFRSKKQAYFFNENGSLGGSFQVDPRNDTSLGLLKNSVNDRERLLSRLPASARAEALSKNPLILTKTNSRARVHRPAYMDYVGVKVFNKEGQVVGEHRPIWLARALWLLVLRYFVVGHERFLQARSPGGTGDAFRHREGCAHRPFPSTRRPVP